MKLKYVVVLVALFAVVGFVHAESFMPDEGIFAYRQVEVFEINGINFTVPTDYEVAFENDTDMHFKHGKDKLKISVIKNGKIKKTRCDHPKTVSLRAWLRRKQKGLQRYLVNTGHFIGSISVEMGYNEYIQGIDTEEDRNMFINRAFHHVLMNCKNQEGAYFRKHDPYTILQRQIVNHQFLFMLPCEYIISGSELEIGTLQDHQKPTMEELQLILQNLDDMKAAAKTAGSKLAEQAPWLPFTAEEN
jgi:hypothetical protein